MHMLLSELNVGQRARIVKLNIENKEIRRHLLDMGLTRGTEIEVRKKAPIGDPIDIKLRDYELCISKSDLSQIEAEVIK
jgi:Fe2+ transport system protein FeoA